MFLVTFDLVKKVKGSTHTMTFETKEQALAWMYVMAMRSNKAGVEFNFHSGAEDNRFWDARKDFWNYRAAKTQAVA